MNIAFLTSRFLPDHSSGTEIYTYGIASVLRDAGHQVSILCARAWDAEESTCRNRVVVENEVYQGMNTRRLSFNWRATPDPCGYIYDHNPETETIASQFLQQQKADLVHITSCVTLSSSLITAARALKLPIVFTMTDYWVICPRTVLQRRDGTFCEGRQDGITCLHCLYGETKIYRLIQQLPARFRADLLKQKIRQPLLRPLLRRSGSLNLIGAVERRNMRLPKLLNDVDCLIAPSRFLADTIAKSGIVPRNRILVSPHGHDVDCTKLGRHKVPSPYMRFGYTGHLLPHKGVHILIKAFNQLAMGDRAHLVIYGDPQTDVNYSSQLQALARDNPSIRFMGRFDNQEIGYILREIDVVVVPSLWYENAPVTIAESFAAKTPVVTANLGGMAEAVQHSVNGLLFKAGDVPDLVRQMQCLLNEPKLLDRLRAGIGPVKSAETEAEELESIYVRLTGQW